jgi:hypothetical protein
MDLPGYLVSALLAAGQLTMWLRIEHRMTILEERLEEERHRARERATQCPTCPLLIRG